MPANCTDAGTAWADEPQARDYGLDLGFSFGVGDGNPHYQLGNLYSPVLSHGLTCGAECPQMTVRDGSSPRLMAANSPANRGPAHAGDRLLVLPVLLDGCPPSSRSRRVRARAATACGLALTRRTRPRQ